MRTTFDSYKRQIADYEMQVLDLNGKINQIN